jgi:glycosyltransferase involved in cell wall biosynthesis
MSRKPVLVVLSHLRWDFVFQRPQHLLTRAAADYDVFFIEEPLFEAGGAGFRELARGAGVTVIQPLLPPATGEGEALLHQGDVAEAIAARAAGRPLHLWYYSPMALAFGHRIAADLVVFDKMDELGAFAFASPGLRGFEKSLLESADLVFTGGASLQAATITRRTDAHCFPSSIDGVHFRAARNGRPADPDDQAGIARPRIGFFGVIDERMDLALVAEVAALRPDWQLVMIGPTAKINPAELPRASNIHWLGPKDYKQLPRYLAHWDMAWMPFALNESTRYISPTKTPEFLAAGLPVASTPIHDVVEPYGRRGLVAIAMDAPAMVAAIERLLRADPAARAARRTAADAHLAGSSWDRTWAAMRTLIDSAAQPAVTNTLEVAHV